MTAPPPAAVPTREGFLKAVRDSNVVPAAQLARAVAAVPPKDDARAAAERLVGSGTLTRFQAERLLAGKGDGFHIGPYLVLDHMGKGGTGRVYKARHAAMGRLVAIKVLATQLTATETDRDAIRAEARRAAALAHPNVVTLLDANTAGDRMYFVREFVDGPTLADLVAVQGPLPAGRACEYIRQAALGLHHAHEKGAAHGAFGPTALLVGTGAVPVVKVSGFGLVAAAGGTRAGIAADLFALGGVLHFALTGRLPNAGPVEARAELPAGVGDLLRSLLHPDPARRPASANDVALRLEAAAALDDAAGRIDFDWTAAKSASASGSLPQITGLPDFGPADAAAANPWDAIVAAGDTADGTSPADPTPVGMRRARPARTGPHPLLLALVVGGVMLGVLAALFAVLQAFGR